MANHPEPPAAVLAELGADPTRRLGEGGEAVVFALDEERVLRVDRKAGRREMGARAALLRELAPGPSGLSIPEILEVGVVGDHEFAEERRLSGTTVSAQMELLDRPARSRLVERHLEASARIGELSLEPRDFFGELIAPRALRTATWREYLVTRLEASLSRAPGFGHINAEAVADAMPSECEPAFVHLDAFVDNMLATGDRVTAVIDFGPTSLVGDRRLDPLTSVVSLCSPVITPVADRTDRDVAMAWLRDQRLADLYEPVRRWIAAYWTAAIDDDGVRRFCTEVLGFS